MPNSKFFGASNISTIVEPKLNSPKHSPLLIGIPSEFSAFRLLSIRKFLSRSFSLYDLEVLLFVIRP
jgi:hypothetical protein